MGQANGSSISDEMIRQLTPDDISRIQSLRPNILNPPLPLANIPVIGSTEDLPEWIDIAKRWVEDQPVRDKNVLRAVIGRTTDEVHGYLAHFARVEGPSSETWSNLWSFLDMLVRILYMNSEFWLVNSQGPRHLSEFAPYAIEFLTHAQKAGVSDSPATRLFSKKLSNIRRIQDIVHYMMATHTQISCTEIITRLIEISSTL